MLTAKGISRNSSSLKPPPPCVSGAELIRPNSFCGIHQGEPGSVANALLPRIGAYMRSQLVYLAGLKIENRFLLSATVMRAVRMLHISSGRTEDTVNRVFSEVAEGRYVDVKLPKIAPPPAIDVLVVTPLV